MFPYFKNPRQSRGLPACSIARRILLRSPAMFVAHGERIHAWQLTVVALPQRSTRSIDRKKAKKAESNQQDLMEQMQPHRQPGGRLATRLLEALSRNL